LPLFKIWGHFANKNIWGRIANKKFIWGHFANKNIWEQIEKKIHGDPFPILFTKIYIHQKYYHAWHENWSTLHVILSRPGLTERINIRQIIP
jgi:hypothetical protein